MGGTNAVKIKKYEETEGITMVIKLVITLVITLVMTLVMTVVMTLVMTVMMIGDRRVKVVVVIALLSTLVRVFLVIKNLKAHPLSKKKHLTIQYSMFYFYVYSTIRV